MDPIKEAISTEHIKTVSSAKLKWSLETIGYDWYTDTIYLPDYSDRVDVYRLIFWREYFRSRARLIYISLKVLSLSSLSGFWYLPKKLALLKIFAIWLFISWIEQYIEKQTARLAAKKLA